MGRRDGCVITSRERDGLNIITPRCFSQRREGIWKLSQIATTPSPPVHHWERGLQGTSIST